MKRYILIFVSLVFVSCSFDNKSGIWKDASDIPLETNDGNSIDSSDSSDSKRRYEDIITKEQLFGEEKNISNLFTIKLDAPVATNNWLERYGSKFNNISNFLYTGNKTLLSRSSKLSSHTSDKNVIFYNNNIISFDHKGKIFIYSLNLKKKTFEYNFYKKNFKNFKKKIYLTVNKNILYAADNLGYIYAINLQTKSLSWAKYYGIPFRSNIKIVDDQILLANQDNLVYSINVKTGDKNWQFATNLTFLKSDFKNNFAVDSISKNLFFLNTSGELYSINYSNQKINWVLNFKNSSLTGDTNLFLSHPITIKNDSVFIATEKALINLNLLTGKQNWVFSSSVLLKPILTNNNVYLILKNNFLVCLENKTGEVLWSKNIYKSLNKKKIKKINDFQDFKMVNNKINLYSKNGYLLSFNFTNGNLENINKISKNGISSEIFFYKKNMYLVDDNSRLLKFN